MARTSSDAQNMTLYKDITEPHLSHSERVSNMKVITEYELNKSTPFSESLLRMQDSVLWGPTGSANGRPWACVDQTQKQFEFSFYHYFLFPLYLRVSLPWAFMFTAAAEVIAFLWTDFTLLPVKLSSAQNWCNIPLRVKARSSGTSLCGDDSNVMPLLLFPIQFHGRGDETIVRGDTEQRLGVWLGINWVPEKKWTGIKEGGQTD